MKKSKYAIAGFLLLILLAPAVSAWEFDRPLETFCFAERQETNKCDGQAAVGLGISIDTYHVGDSSYGGDDWQRLNIVATANTREIIDYSAEEWGYGWYELGNDKQIPYLGANYDDDGLIDLASVNPRLFYFIRFYGGPKSGEYIWTNWDSVFVSTNGFICFDAYMENGSYVGDWKSYPYNIPDYRGPNAFIAPFWTDLRPDLGGKIKADIVTWGTGYDNALCVTWENIPDANGQTQTFQVLISFPTDFSQSAIKFQYKQVVPNSTVKIGIECQTGKKGSSYSPLNVGNGKALLLKQSSFYAYISYLTIKIVRVTPAADINIIEDPDLGLLRGHNIKFKEQEPDPGATFALALSGDIVLLIMGIPGMPVEIAVMGFLLGNLLIGYDIAHYLATNMFPAKELIVEDLKEVNFAKAPAYPSYQDNPNLIRATVVDADLGICVDWVLRNLGDQEIRVYAELDYFVCDGYGAIQNYTTLQTEQIPLILRRDAGNTINDPNIRTIVCGTYRAVLGPVDTSDFYKISVQQSGKMLVAWLTPPSNADYDLYLYGPDKMQKAYSPNRGNGVMEWIAYPANPTGDWYIEAKYYAGTSGKYELEVSTYDFEGGCPFLYAWNGKDYVIDNNLLPTSARSSGTDVEDFYKLEQSTIPIHQNPLFSLYSLQIREFQTEHSYLDQVKLFAVDHQPDVNIAVAQDGEILTYKNPHPPISCTNKYGYNMLDRIQHIDQDYYQGYPDDYLLLNFGNLSVKEGAKLVMRADMEHVKESIHIQILNETGEWQTIAKIIPRVYWATEIVNLAPYLLNSTGNVQIRLYFTAYHKLDYVGLDTTPQADITTRQSLLISAIHSEKGLITLKLLRNDQNYAELIPDQQINLLFALPQKQNQTTTTTFIFYTNGHYNTIK